MRSRNEAFTLIEVMIATAVVFIVFGAIAGVLIMSQKTVTNVSDEMTLVQAGRTFQIVLKNDINLADGININAGGEELELLNNNGSNIVARYRYNSTRKIIEYARENESGNLETRPSFPRQECNIDDVNFQFIDDTNSIRYEVDFSKVTASKKEDNFLTNNIESVVKIRGMYD